MLIGHNNLPLIGMGEQEVTEKYKFLIKTNTSKVLADRFGTTKFMSLIVLFLSKTEIVSVQLGNTLVLKVGKCSFVATYLLYLQILVVVALG